MFETGLASAVGTGLVNLSGAQSLWAVTTVSLVIGILLTEITSNTAATNMLVPVVISICQVGQINPVPPSLGACVGASMAFMLPISTPPNAIVYGSGLVPITTMIRKGVLLDVIAGVIVFVGLRILCPLLGLA
jgi:sodium-dependent dicarboxylate transporter 2/3/5